MSKFNLRIEGEKVDLNGIKGGIKREDIKDEKMRSIFDAFDREGGKADQVLSDNEVKEMLGFVKKRAQHNNPNNLGDREYNKLLKKFSKKLGINLDVSKSEFLQFIKTLDEVSKNPSSSVVEPEPKVEDKPKATDEFVQPRNEDGTLDLGELKEKGSESEQEQVVQDSAAKSVQEPPPAPSQAKTVTPKRRPAGTSAGGRGNGSAPAAAKTFKAEDIKVTVPHTEQSKYAKQIEGYRQEGAKLKNSLKKGDTNGLTTQNIAYAFTEDIHFGPNSKAAAKKVFSLLYSRMAQLKLLEKDDCKSYERFSKMSFKEQDVLLHDYRNRIVMKEREVVRKENARVVNENARPAQQKVFDGAAKFLTELANNPPKDKIEKNEGFSKLKLDDGRFVEVWYDKAGEIKEVRVSYDTTLDKEKADQYDVIYYPKESKVNTDINKQGFEGSVKTGEQFFAKIKEMADAIFAENKPEVKEKSAPAEKKTKDVVAGEGKAEAEDIKVTVPQTEQSKYAKQIDEYRKEGAKLHDSLKKGDTNGLTTQNVAYAFTEDIHFGPNSKAAAKKVFSLLYSRMAQLKLLEKEDCKSYDRFSQMSLKEQDALLHDYRNRIVMKEREVVRTENTRVATEKARPANQKVFDEANKVLVDAANNASKIKDDAFTVDAEKKSATLILDGDREIKVHYNDFGKIIDVFIAYKKGQYYDVYYDAENANVKTDNNNTDWGGIYKSGFDFDKIREVAQQIFEKHINAIPPAVTPDEEGKYTAHQVNFGVKYNYYPEEQFKQAMSDGEKIRTGKLGFDKLNPKNAAYCFGEEDDVVASGHAKKIFANLRARMINLFSYKKNKIVYNSQFAKMTTEEQNKIIHQYAEDIKNQDKYRLTALNYSASKTRAEDAKKAFNHANKFLAEAASNPPESDKIIYDSNEYGKYAIADIGDGKWIKVTYLSSGSVYSVSIGHTENDKSVEDIKYGSYFTYVGGSSKGRTENYDFDKIKEFAKQIFGEWKEPVEKPKAEE